MPDASTAPDTRTNVAASTDDEIRRAVRAHYASAITAIPADSGASCCAPDSFAAGQYDAADLAGVAPGLVNASFGCGNPLVVADLSAGERVLDLGSGGGLDVLLSARRVGATGYAYGLDMTDEMLERARHNAAEAGATNVEFLKGTIEEIPLADASVDVVISNCVINLSPDKNTVFGEIHRVLAPGGRLGVSDIVWDDDVTPEQRAQHGDWASCAAGALTRGDYTRGLEAAGFVDVEVRFTHDFDHGMHSAVVRAVKPVS